MAALLANLVFTSPLAYFSLAVIALLGVIMWAMNEFKAYQSRGKIRYDNWMEWYYNQRKIDSIASSYDSLFSPSEYANREYLWNNLLH